MSGSLPELILGNGFRNASGPAKFFAVLVVLGMLLVAIPAALGAEESIDYLDGDDSVTSVTVEFTAGGTDKTHAIVLDRFANATSASLNISAAPKTVGGTDVPTDLSVKVGDDIQDLPLPGREDRVLRGLREPDPGPRHRGIGEQPPTHQPDPRGEQEETE